MDGYSVIDEKVSPTPAPPLRSQSNRHRPPEPLPSTKRPHSESSPPDPVVGGRHTRNTLPHPPRPQSASQSASQSGSADYSKSKPLPRPPCGPKPRPLTMGTFPRVGPEPSSLGTPAQGFNNVLNQLGSLKLHSPYKTGNTYKPLSSNIILVELLPF